MNKYKAILDGVIATLLKGGEAQKEIAEILNSDEESLDDKAVLSQILEADKARVKALRTSYFDDGHKKGKGEALTAQEKKLREQYNIQDDVSGEDLITLIIESNSKKSDKELNDDSVKRHKAYIQLQDQAKKQLEDLRKEYDEKISAQEKTFNKEKVFNSISEKALATFESLKPILSEDPQKAAKQRQILINELKGFEYEEQDGKIIILKEGKVWEDQHGHRVELDNLVKDTAAQYFDFRKAEEDRSSPNGGKKGEAGAGAGSGKKFSGKWPANEAEYMNILSDTSLPLADRSALQEEWKAASVKV
jgi:hypothetical protein